ncbi:ComEC/Rec2 family competence protein [Aquimarina longa]|uniref:ComEC/Rec2 family competence protein n=1 Tax=Aquimarina longa TaxID=1080221 RepID=UPI001F0776E5|nr:ComEC/Rec2 family competence protein [Aquimarina longa]
MALLFGIFCVLSFFWYYSKKIFYITYSFAMIMIAFFLVFGIALVQIHNPKNYSNHYSTHMHQKTYTESDIGIRFYIKERLKPSSYYTNYIVSIKFIDTTAAKGNLLLQIPRDSTLTVLDIGNTYTTFTTLKTIPKPLNPDQFNYAKYLNNQYIFDKITLQPHQLINNHKIEHSISYLADQIRKHIRSKLLSYNFTSKELSIINALLLGQRQNISQETFNEYRDAGAIHILAVSGLHVGILLLILNLILKPLDNFRKKGVIIKLILTITALWSFAVIAGLSPSVLRAATMFSFLAIGMQIRSKVSIYNSLFISIFILTCFSPLLLFSVGFQLSYLAVFSIVWIQPLLVRIYRPRFYISRKLWETFTVTIAAQLGLLPLTLFYFHQFPILFFVSNLMIIPFLGGILGLGIVTILLAAIDMLPKIIATVFGLSINTMNLIVSWVAQQEAFVIKNISFSSNLLITLYLVIVVSIIVFHNYNRSKLYWLVAPTLLLSLVFIYEEHISQHSEEFIIFHNYHNTTLGVLQNKQLQVYSKDSISTKTQNFLFGNYLIENRATLDTTIQLRNIYQYKKQTILVIDSSSIYSLKKFYPDIILLSNSPKIHLDRVIDSLHPKQIVADASNYKRHMDQWEISCEKREVPFHRIDKKGAFIIK